jgi:ubiquinone/menaquinone biosynthesis C-methylase UbiE
MSTTAATPNFDLIARPYRWLEYLTLGTALQRARTRFLPDLLNRRSALVLGDGDGRFLAQLLRANPTLHADAVDISTAMLALLAQRCHAAAPTAAARLTIHNLSALAFSPSRSYDLVATHFFLDCLTQPEIELLVARITPHLQPGALWLISDFRIPTGPRSYLATLLVRSLYFAFRLLTGLRTTHLPDHAAALNTNFTCIAQHYLVGGLLTTELWQRTSTLTSSTSANPLSNGSPAVKSD